MITTSEVTMLTIKRTKGRLPPKIVDEGFFYFYFFTKIIPMIFRILLGPEQGISGLESFGQ